MRHAICPLTYCSIPHLDKPPEAHQCQKRQVDITMADKSSTPAVESGDGFTKEYVDKLKADLASKAEEAAMLKAFKSTHDQKQRDVISKLQPDINSYMEALMKDHPDHADDMKPLVDWSRSCHESNSLETAMPLARVMSCASAQFKRTREEASVASEKAGTLGATMKELEDLKASDSAKAQRLSELETHCNELQTANGALQEELAKAGIIKDKFDFSKLSSRETSASKDKVMPNAEASATGGDAQLINTTSNASRVIHSMDDQLMSFVRGSAKGMGSSKIIQSATGHSYLGATQGTLEGEIDSAMRGF